MMLMTAHETPKPMLESRVDRQLRQLIMPRRYSATHNFKNVDLDSRRSSSDERELAKMAAGGREGEQEGRSAAAGPTLAGISTGVAHLAGSESSTCRDLDTRCRR